MLFRLAIYDLRFKGPAATILGVKEVQAGKYLPFNMESCSITLEFSSLTDVKDLFTQAVMRCKSIDTYQTFGQTS
jgi:hypothetical protein